MKSISFTIQAINDLIDRMSPLYDFVVLADPEERRSLYVGENGDLLYGNLCYADIGAVDERYLDLPFHVSKQDQTHVNITEVRNGVKFTITRNVIEIVLEDGTVRSCYLDLLNAYDTDEESSSSFTDSTRAGSVTGYTFDNLTHIYDREGFYKAVREQLDNVPNLDMILVGTNIKDFKLINELFGMEKGNRVLKQFAEILESMCGKNDVCGRLQSDHFCLLIEKNKFDRMQFLRAMQEISDTLVSKHYTMYVHAGIYDISDPDQEISIMCDKANMAISTIKNDSQSEIAYYENDMMQKTLYEQEILNEFSHALENGEFIVYLQPQVDFDGRVQGAEALVRWDHPRKGLIGPDEFISILETAGMIHKLDYYIWKKAVSILKRWKDQGREDMTLSVNISPNDIYYLNIVDVLDELVNDSDVSPGNLKLEITETTLMTDLDKHNDVIHDLHDKGFEIEIDDFGSGYSSLAVLKNLEADILKIDMEFLRETDNRSRSRIILNSVIRMAKQLGMPVITEGIEDEQQANFLKSLGSDMFQGYYFSKPLPLEDFEAKYL